MSVLHLVFAAHAPDVWAEAKADDAIVLAGGAVVGSRGEPPATAAARVGVLATDLRDRGLLERVDRRYEILDDDRWLDWHFDCRLTRTWP
ncbi:MAG: hypothetical protein AAGE01_03860 [Pseudomonadota bacterium]